MRTSYQSRRRVRRTANTGWGVRMARATWVITSFTWLLLLGVVTGSYVGAMTTNGLVAVAMVATAWATLVPPDRDVALRVFAAFVAAGVIAVSVAAASVALLETRAPLVPALTLGLLSLATGIPGVLLARRRLRSSYVDVVARLRESHDRAA